MSEEARRKLRQYEALLQWWDAFERVAQRARFGLCVLALVGLISVRQLAAVVIVLCAAVGFFCLAGIRWMLLRRHDALWRALRDEKETGDADG